MGRALPQRSLSVSEQVASLHTALVAAEARRRSWLAGGLLLVALVMLSSAPRLLPGLLGEVTPMVAAIAAGACAATWLVASLMFRTVGVDHPLYIVAAFTDELCAYAALLALIYCGGSASSPLWLVVLARSFSWLPVSRDRSRRTIFILIMVHAGLAIAFCMASQPADAFITGLMLGGAMLGHLITAPAHLHALTVRAERDRLDLDLRVATREREHDRLARELHDGLGADAMALLLRLRRAAEQQESPAALQLAAQAQRIVADLRSIIVTLRNGQGTFGELARLVDGRCRPLCGAAAFSATVAIGCEDRSSRAPR